MIDSGATTSFQVGVANLANPFGGPDGFSLQLVDIYVHQPGLASGDYSTEPIDASRNYTIAPGEAWSQVTEVDGFGRAIWQRPDGDGVGHIAAVSGTAADNQITITVPTAQLGTPGAGWGFTVALWGQDGFGTNDARAITPTPQAYTFGVCSATEAAEVPQPAVCQVDPTAELEVMDTVPPAGIDVRTKLNVLDDPGNTPSDVATSAVLQGLTVPASGVLLSSG